MPEGFTGFRIESHLVSPPRQVCVCYVDGKRIAVVYLKPPKEIKIVYEPDVGLTTLHRTGLTTFEETKH